MSANKRPSQPADRLLEYLRRLKDDRGAMADLRRSLTPSQRHRAWPRLATVGGIGNRRVQLIAGLYAYHPSETDTGNLGTTCRRLTLENSTFETRFRRLLACDGDEIGDRLRPIILAARAKGIAINYARLLGDLSRWGDSVKTDWAREYWCPETASETTTTEPQA